MKKESATSGEANGNRGPSVNSLVDIGEYNELEKEKIQQLLEE